MLFPSSDQLQLTFYRHGAGGYDAETIFEVPNSEKYDRQ